MASTITGEEVTDEEQQSTNLIASGSTEDVELGNLDIQIPSSTEHDEIDQNPQGEAAVTIPQRRSESPMFVPETARKCSDSTLEGDNESIMSRNSIPYETDDEHQQLGGAFGYSDEEEDDLAHMNTPDRSMPWHRDYKSRGTPFGAENNEDEASPVRYQRRQTPSSLSDETKTPSPKVATRNRRPRPSGREGKVVIDLVSEDESSSEQYLNSGGCEKGSGTRTHSGHASKRSNLSIFGEESEMDSGLLDSPPSHQGTPLRKGGNPRRLGLFKESRSPEEMRGDKIRELKEQRTAVIHGLNDLEKCRVDLVAEKRDLDNKLKSLKHANKIMANEKVARARENSENIQRTSKRIRLTDEEIRTSADWSGDEEELVGFAGSSSSPSRTPQRRRTKTATTNSSSPGKKSNSRSPNKKAGLRRTQHLFKSHSPLGHMNQRKPMEDSSSDEAEELRPRIDDSDEEEFGERYSGRRRATK